MSVSEDRQFRKHHYVPQWYQAGFLEPGTSQRELHYFALKQEHVINADGKRRPVRQLRRRPISQTFAETDLYTLRFGERASVAIEKEFFGPIDDRGSQAVKWWSDFAHPSMDRNAVQVLPTYLSSQKLRSPKGLDWLAQQLGESNQNRTLDAMVQLELSSRRSGLSASGSWRMRQSPRPSSFSRTTP